MFKAGDKYSTKSLYSKPFVITTGDVERKVSISCLFSLEAKSLTLTLFAHSCEELNEGISFPLFEFEEKKNERDY